MKQGRFLSSTKAPFLKHHPKPVILRGVEDAAPIAVVVTPRHHRAKTVISTRTHCQNNQFPFNVWPRSISSEFFRYAPSDEAQRDQTLEKNMKKISFLCTALMMMIATAALSQDVRYNYDKGTDFSKFKTYKWVLIKDAQKPNDIVDKQIKSTIDSQLLVKGLTATDSDTADLYLAYQTAIDSEKQFTSFSSGMGPGWGYGGGWYGGGWYGGGGMSTTTGSTSTIYVGQLVLDMYKPADKDLVWRGTVSKTLDPKAKPDKQQKNLNKAVAKLLKNYPPPPGK
jgi:hypothetical protein